MLTMELAAQYQDAHSVTGTHSFADVQGELQANDGPLVELWARTEQTRPKCPT